MAHSTQKHPTHNTLGMTQDQLAHLGDGALAYMKQIKSEDLPNLFPEAPKMRPGIDLFALHAADGTPILLADSREAVIANAWQHELQMVSLH